MIVRSLASTLKRGFARSIKRQIRQKDEYRQLGSKDLFNEKFGLLKESVEDTIEGLCDEEREMFEKGYEIMSRLSKAEKDYLLYKIMKEDSLYKDESVQTNHLIMSNPHNSFDVYESDIFSSFGSSQAVGESTANQVSEEAEEESKEESKVVDLCLESFDAAQKLKIIKELKAILGIGLKETKELLEKGPGVLKEKVSREDAEQLQEKLTKLGYVTTLK